MKVIVIGNGGREHTLAYKLLQSSRVTQVFCIPGNAGTATLERCQNVPLAVDHFEGIARVAIEQQIDLVVVGPELPLSLGITDYLQEQNIRVFGPNKVAAQLEASKSWAKSLMYEASIPAAHSGTFSDIESAKTYLQKQGTPIVIKADGLASGKGVIVAHTEAEAQQAVDELFAGGFTKLLIEDYLEGEEVSILALTDGLTIRPLLPAQDHKRVGDGDTGKNTGGMGAYAPSPLVTPELMERIQQEVLEPTLQTLKNRGIDYRGIIYVGLMITPSGEPKVLEYNCRFGDPETQAILPLLETSLIELILACLEQRLGEFPPIAWKNESSVCVVVASGGYPDSYEKGKVIKGIKEAESEDVIVFHAGTICKDDHILTDGGRVLGVTAVSESFETAIEKAYQAVNLIQFEGMYYRHDIGNRLLGKT
ncbi:phosphoribosylamine--glycine ligase [Aphanothece hegewaldii CCALA 016]|uniref:Phosphoribosylamine--glycine ligase n=1 Tax=Aphanothece hegewaldii CCALA 016 TaxID=2107694 RepID=A0A2T1LWD4_9CHRO|nr:phosphoribosylamine--glycine ligase [Aphanothece hegewaldii]PSF36225.1 phosphoribosylamine--glycine ligase [Aphanothece hegewaldii CCALA 016]